MLNKKQIMDQLSILREIIDPKDFIVVSGASLVIHDIKTETRDVDIYLRNKDAFQELIEKGYKPEDFLWFHKISINGFIDVFDDIRVKGFVPDYEMIDEFCIQTVDSVREFKVKAKREKDTKDIEIIDSLK